MKTPTREQMLVSIPALCQILVEFIEETSEGGTNVYRQKLKHHANGLIEGCDKFLEAVYGHATKLEHNRAMGEEQNEIAISLKNAIAEGLEIIV